MTRNLNKKQFSISIAIVAALGFATLSYSVLRMNSSLGTLYIMTSNIYFYSYILITLFTAVLFGINTSLLILAWYSYGIKNLFAYSGSGVSAALSIIASSCPICGSTLLSLIATATSLTFLSSAGFELKIISFVLLLFSTLYTYKKLILEKCIEGVCPNVIKRSFANIMYLPVLLAFFIFTIIDFNLWKTDSLKNISSGMQDFSAYSCNVNH